MEQQLKLAQTEAELDSYRKQKEQNLVIAKETGYVYEFDEFLRKGLIVEEKKKLASVAPERPIDVVAYMHEDQAGYIQVGDRLEFKPLLSFESLIGEVVSVSPVRTQYLRYPQLASTFGGDLPVVEMDKNQYKMIESYYTVEIRLDEGSDVRFGRTGYVEFWGPWRSRALMLIEYVFSGILSESGF